VKLTVFCVGQLSDFVAAQLLEDQCPITRAERKGGAFIRRAMKPTFLMGGHFPVA
jgi:hypothetical protein